MVLLYAEKFLSINLMDGSDDYERYVRMGLQIDPKYSLFLKCKGELLDNEQKHIPWPERDYSYIDLLRKAYENETVKDPLDLHQIRDAEARRDFWTGSIREINHLIQVTMPNIQLKDARCEIYKISVSFDSSSKFLI